MLFALLAVLSFGLQSSLSTVQAQNIDFSASGLGGETLNNPTSLQFGPDGRLYVSQQNGTIYAYNVIRNGEDDYQVGETETINIVKNIENHNDDGSSTSQGNRQITGIYLTGTGSNPVMYVSSSDPRIGAGGGGNDKGLDTNSGIVSRVTCIGGISEDNNGFVTCDEWQKVDIVRGLPRSEENHATNGMQLDETTNTLYLAVGGHTNAGAPSNNFAFTVEYTYSSTIIAIDLDMIDTMDVLTDPNGSLYVYDLLTLDDPTRDNVFADGTPASEDPRDPNYSPLDVGDPFGGNDGLNMAKIDLAGPVSIHSIGFRNLYDIAITVDGRMYGVDNGANGNWGGHPEGEADYDAEYASNPQCTNNYLSNEPGSTGSGPGGDDQVNNKNGLQLIQPLTTGMFNYVAGQDYYYGGHPHPILANPGIPLDWDNVPAGPVAYNPGGAGLYTFSQDDNNGGPGTIDDHTDPNPTDGQNESLWRTQILDPSNPNFQYESLPVDWPPVPVGEEMIAGCDFRNSGQDDNSLANYGPSTNGIAEYTASNFNGALQGYLLLAAYNGNIYQVELSADGTEALNCPTVPQNGSSTVSNCNDSFASGFGATPLDVIAQGDDDVFAGTVWAVTYGADNVTIFEPADYDGNDPGVCEGIDSETLDEDNDDYTNADEIDNGTNPCSGASQPDDFDQAYEAGANNSEFLVSDLNDDDDDNDGILDVDDPFNFDVNNGLSDGSNGSINSQLPMRLEFFNSTGYGYGTIGFTGLMTNGTDDYFSLLDDSGDELVFGGTAGIYTDPTVAPGDSYQATNTQQNGFQFGIDVDTTTGPFTVESQINGNPFFNNDSTPDNFASQGIYIGTGDQDNYVKFVLTGNVTGQPAGFQILQESNGSVVTGGNNDQKIPIAGILDATAIQLYLSVDPVAGTVQASYSIDGGERIDVGNPVQIVGDTLAAVQGTYTITVDDTPIPTALAVGTIATSTGPAAEFGASWDYFDISQNPSESTAVITVNTNGINGSTFGDGSFVIENTSSNGTTITNVVIDLAGNGDVLVPEVVFDPDGNAGDGTAKDVTFSTGETASGYTGHTFGGAYEGGFYVLDMDFNDFDPSESVAFGLDIDPVSIKGGSSPGPNQSGSVSGLELTGATVTVTFSTGEVWEVDLFRTPDNDSDSTVIARNALPLPVTIEMVGVDDGDVLFSPNQTILVQGEVGEEVRLLHVESGLFVADLTGPHAGVGYDIDPFEVNSVIGINEYTDFISNSFDVTFDVTLTNTEVNATDPTGYNTFVAVVVDDDGATSNVSNFITVQYDPTAAPETLYRVNAANATIPATDDGPDWVATGPAGAQDNDGFSVNIGNLSTHDITGRDASVPDYAPQDLFAQERWDAPSAPEMQWSFDVTPGTYVVNLFMGNGFSGTSAVGDRVFDISVEGQLLGNDIDLVALFGHQVGGMVSYTVDVDDNSLDILFEHVVENPTVNAIEILTYTGNNTGDDITIDAIADQSNVEGDDISNAGLFVTADGGDGNLSYSADGLPDGVSIEPTNGQFVGVVADGAASNSPYTVTVNVDDDDTDTDDAATEIFTWTITEPLAPGQVLFRVNAGGPEIVVANDVNWSQDTGTFGAATNSDYLVQLSTGTSTYNSSAGSSYGSPDTSDPSIPAGTPPEIFDTERYDPPSVPTMLWQFPVASGTDVEIRIYFAEIFNGVDAAGQRVFDILVDGTVPTVFDDIDPFAQSGAASGFMLSYQTTSDGTIDLEFLAGVENPAIKGIEIVTLSSEAPVIDAIDDVTYGVLAEFGQGDGFSDSRFVVSATDEQEDGISYGAQGLPDGLSIDATTGEIQGIITEAALTGGNGAGVHTVTITATDDSPEQNSSTETFVWTVVERTIDISLPVDGSTIAPTDALSVDWTSGGGDLDYFDHIHIYFYAVGDFTFASELHTAWLGSQDLNPASPITITESTKGDWEQYFDANGFLLPGEYVIEARHAQPSHDEYDHDRDPNTTGDFGIVEPVAVTFTVSNDISNLPPEVTNPGDQTNVEGETISLPISATAPEQGQTLTYSAEGLPAGLTIDPDTGVISGMIDAGSPATPDGAFIEENGLVVIEMESADNIPNNWETSDTYSTTFSPNVNNPANATGDDFIIWQAGQSLGTPGNGLITYQVQINTPGTYRFQWRNQVGNGTNTTEHNDTWLKIEADAFYGLQSGTNFVCPKGYDPQTNDCTGDVPEGAGSNGWFKIYSSGANNWSWVSNTSDSDAHQIYARFDEAGTYNILVSARSSSHAIDRMVLYTDDYTTAQATNISLAESDRVAGNAGGDGASADSPYNVTITVTDDGSPAESSTIDFVWTVDEAVGNPSAFVQVNPGAGLSVSTFGNNSFQIENTGDLDITNITINSSTAFMPDVVFDPVGKAGDNGAKCLTTGTAGNTAAEVGITVPANGGSDAADCESVFNTPHNGVDDEEGYDVITLDFTDFNPGESYAFGVDMDPTSIKGDLSTGDAGSISGFELIGSTVTITFASGESITTTLTDEGSLGGSEAVVQRSLPNAPSLAVDGLADPAQVTDINQTLIVTGVVGEEISVIQIDGRLYIDPGNPNIGYDVDPFEANEAVAKVIYTGTIPADGTLELPVTLLETIGAPNTPDGGINHFIAFYNDGTGSPYGNGSNTVVLELVEEEPTATLNATISLQGRSDYSGDVTVEIYEVGAATPSYTLTATVDVDGNLTIAGIDAGTWEVAIKHPQYLQEVLTLTLVVGENTATFDEFAAGDANDDNAVSAIDFSVLAGTFNLQDGDEGYNSNADFNGDGAVTALDFSLLTSNFNQSGDVPTGVTE